MNLIGLYKKKKPTYKCYACTKYFNMLIVRYFYVNKDENNRKEKKNRI